MAIIDAAEQLANFRNEQLEKEVREALVLREKTRYRQYFESHPKLADEVRDTRAGLYASFKESFKQVALEVAEEEKKEIDEKINKLQTANVKFYGDHGKLAVLNMEKGMIDEKLKGIDGEIESIIQGDPQLKEILDGISIDGLCNTAGGPYESSYLDTLLKTGLAVGLASPKEAPALKKALELAKGNEGYMKLNDIFVNRVVEIARDKGMEHALKEDTIYSVKKWLFPTLEDYQKHAETTKKMTVEGLSLFYEAFNSQVAALTGEDAKAKQHVSALGQSIARMVEYHTKLVNGIDGELAKLEMDKIYDKPSPLDMERARILEIYAKANNSAGKQ